MCFQTRRLFFNVFKSELNALLPDTLVCQHPSEVVELVNNYLNSKDLGGLTRAGL